MPNIRESEARMRILRYEHGQSSWAAVLCEGPTNMTNDDLLKQRDLSLGFDIDAETAHIDRDDPNAKWPRFTVEVKEAGGDWQQIGEFDNITHRCPRPATSQNEAVDRTGDLRESIESESVHDDEPPNDRPHFDRS